jgi:chromosome segregation ATPase
MALTKKMLKAMGLTDDQIEQIFDGHEESLNVQRETISDIKNKLEKAEAETERLKNVEKDLLKANAKIEEAEETAKKLKSLRDEYDSYKAEVVKKATKESKGKAYRKLLSAAGIPEKRHDSIVKLTDLDAVEMDESGNITNAKDLSKNIAEEWADFIVTKSEQGSSVPTPPEVEPIDYDSMSDNDYYKATYDKKKG